MPNTYNADDLDAVEHLIATSLENDRDLQPVWAYFHWETEPDGVPYLNIKDIPAHRSMTMPGKNGQIQHVQARVVKQFSLFCIDRNESRRLEIAFTRLFDTMKNKELKDNAYCNSVVQEIDWNRTFVKEKNELFDNIWHSMTRVAFRVERFAGGD